MSQDASAKPAVKVAGLASAAGKPVEKTCNVCNREYHAEADFLVGTSRWRLCAQGHLWFNCGCGSTLMLKRGKFDWWSPDLGLSGEARTVFNGLGNLKELPHIPTAVLGIQQLLQTPDIEPKAVAQEVRKDPVLAAQILRIAETLRSARAPDTGKLRSLDHAIVYVGFKALSELVLTGALRALPLPACDFDLDAFWRESYLTGAIAERIMRRFAPTLNPDEVFLAGSLCNIGKLVQVFCFPPTVNKIVRDVAGSAGTPVTWRQAEATYAFPDHAVLGEIAAALWGFPIYIATATRRHHEQAAATGKALEMDEVTAVANQMTHWVLLRPHRMEEALVQAFAKRVGITETQLDAFALELTTMQRALTPAPAPG